MAIVERRRRTVAVSMVKGQRISLEKSGGALTLVRMGLGWDAVKKKGLFGARPYRQGGGWKMNAIGEPGQGRTLHDLLPAIAAHA
ncbi:hypothetical protein ABT299_40485 [Spirillospora sp. NPDC000708]